jgi:hypothetical protein
MMLVLGTTGLWYLMSVIRAWPDIGRFFSLELAVGWLVLLVVASVVAQVGVAVSDSKGAECPPDERERPIIQKAGNWSGLVLGTGIVSSLMLYLWHGDGNMLFHAAMVSLTIAAVAEYAFQSVLLRRCA